MRMTPTWYTTRLYHQFQFTYIRVLKCDNLSNLRDIFAKIKIKKNALQAKMSQKKKTHVTWIPFRLLRRIKKTFSSNSHSPIYDVCQYRRRKPDGGETQFRETGQGEATHHR